MSSPCLLDHFVISEHCGPFSFSSFLFLDASTAESNSNCLFKREIILLNFNGFAEIQSMGNCET